MMILPQNGSVLIVDDQPKQALPIISALSKKGVATTWYRGNDPDEIPSHPVQKTRLIFMDLQLVEGDNDSHTIASRVLSLLEALIPTDNGPFILVVWSLKEALYGEEVKKRLQAQTNYLRPVCIVSMNKRECIRQIKDNRVEELTEAVTAQLKKAGFEEDDLQSVVQAIENNWIVDRDAEFEVVTDAISKIERAISQELKKAGIFHLFVIWENLIKESAAQTVAQISQTIKSDENWEQNMRDVFRRMGVARVGLNQVSDEELLKESILTFILSFADNLERKIQEVELPEHTSILGDQLLKVNYNNGELRLVKEENLIRLYSDTINSDRKAQTLKLFEAKDFATLDKSIQKSGELEKAEIANHALDIYKSIPPKLNNGLHLDLNPTNILIPGNIYEMEISESDRSHFTNTYFENLSPDEIKAIRFIELEVSPICDYAQKKWKKSRLLSGVIYPATITKLRVKNEHLYKAHPIFELENRHVKITFDYHLLKSLEKESVRNRKTLKYRMRRELLIDIIANVSAHVNRPGISFME